MLLMTHVPDLLVCKTGNLLPCPFTESPLFCLTQPDFAAFPPFRLTRFFQPSQLPPDDDPQNAYESRRTCMRRSLVPLNPNLRPRLIDHQMALFPDALHQILFSMR